MSLVSKKFINKMESELQVNETKGCWLEWHPTKEEAMHELMHHVYKLSKAMKSDDKNGIAEFSADVANISEKIFTEHS